VIPVKLLLVEFPSSPVFNPADLCVIGGVNFLTSWRRRKETQPTFLCKASADRLTLSGAFLNAQLHRELRSAFAAMFRQLFMGRITPDRLTAFLTAFHTDSYA
jgi:hypothetical protein